MNNLRRDLVDLTTQRTARLEAAPLRCGFPRLYRIFRSSGC